MDFRILGPLAILLVHANEVASAERLLDDLWGERRPTSGVKALHVYVSQLRKVVGEGRILTTAPVRRVLRRPATRCDPVVPAPCLRGASPQMDANAAFPAPFAVLLRTGAVVARPRSGDGARSWPKWAGFDAHREPSPN